MLSNVIGKFTFSTNVNVKVIVNLKKLHNIFNGIISQTCVNGTKYKVSIFKWTLT